jgi:hypothetical protein
MAPDSTSGSPGPDTLEDRVGADAARRCRWRRTPSRPPAGPCDVTWRSPVRRRAGARPARRTGRPLRRRPPRRSGPDRLSLRRRPRSRSRRTSVSYLGAHLRQVSDQPTHHASTQSECCSHLPAAGASRPCQDGRQHPAPHQRPKPAETPRGSVHRWRRSPARKRLARTARPTTASVPTAEDQPARRQTKGPTREGPGLSRRTAVRL